MTTLFYILLGLAIWHFLYESVIAPSLRHGLRYEFFTLRDELRNLSFKGLSLNDKKIYSLLDNNTCGIIESMHFISVGNYYLLRKRFSSDKKAKQDVQKMKNLIESADNQKLVKIDKKISQLGTKALMINNGALLFYLIVPLFIFFVGTLFFIGAERAYKSSFKKISEGLIYSHDIVDDGSPLGIA